MNARIHSLCLLGLLVLLSSTASQPSDPASSGPPPDATETTSLTPEQDELFDELLQQEMEREPEAARVLQEDPAEAAELVESTEDLPSPAPAPAKSRVIGTFIQLSREWAKLSPEGWAEVLDLIEGAGLHTIIVQWTAAGEIAYFEPAPEAHTEIHPVLNQLFEALRGRDINLVLGLGHDPEYWKNIEVRNDVRDVYLRVLNTRDLRIQEALLEQFGEEESWTGYYLSEEIDDINWREPADEQVFHQYLLRASRIIRERDPERTIAISSFFRKRTAPETYANNLADLMTATEINRLWIQDGIGVEFLGAALIEPYYQALATRFAVPPPGLGVVVELFEMTSAEDEPFAAQPALTSRVENQLQNASLIGGPLILFSLFDYADPRRGGTEEEIYQLIQEWNSAIAPPVVE